jgi:hypothetical protein
VLSLLSGKPDINPTVNRRVEGGFEVRIYNLLGEWVITVGARHAVPLQRIDVSGLAEGIYFVRYGDNVGRFLKIL